jgi:hypothetical protein
MKIRFNAAPFSVARSWISFAASTGPTCCNLIFQILHQVTSLSHALASVPTPCLSCTLQLAACGLRLIAWQKLVCIQP